MLNFTADRLSDFDRTVSKLNNSNYTINKLIIDGFPRVQTIY
jgi:hypothetical protein